MVAVLGIFNELGGDPPVGEACLVGVCPPAGGWVCELRAVEGGLEVVQSPAIGDVAGFSLLLKFLRD